MTLTDGFNQYISDSIKSEAKVNLRAIAEGALAFHLTEHPADPSGMSFFTAQYPKSETQSQIGPTVGADTVKKTYIPTADMFDTDVWRQLNFMTTTKSYYTYYYISDGNEFVVKASASINRPCDSIFMIKGTTNNNKEPTHTPVVDLSEDPNAIAECNTVKLH